MPWPSGTFQNNSIAFVYVWCKALADKKAPQLTALRKELAKSVMGRVNSKEGDMYTYVHTICTLYRLG